MSAATLHVCHSKEAKSLVLNQTGERTDLYSSTFNVLAFAEAMDHWSNIDTAIDLLAGNLMWTAPPQVYAMSIKILDLIVKEATFSQSAPILAKLTKAQYYLREAFEDGKLNDGQRMF